MNIHSSQKTLTNHTLSYHSLEQNKFGHMLSASNCPSLLTLSTQMHSVNSTTRDGCESFIAEKFSQKHGAKVREFMPKLIELKRGESTSSALGVRTFVDRPFFLEQYIDKPIEIEISRLCKQSMNKTKVVEIGNFAASNVRSGSLLFTIVAKSLFQAGYEWMVFTAINDVEKMIERLGCEQFIITPAQKSTLGDCAEDWGSYYDNAPNVIACNLRDSITKAQKNKRLNNIFLEYSQQISTLAKQMSANSKEHSR